MEKERKPLRHPAGGVHGYDIQYCFGLCSLIQLCHNPIRSRPKRRLELPFLLSTTLRLRAFRYICRFRTASGSPALGRPRGGPDRRIPNSFYDFTYGGIGDRGIPSKQMCSVHSKQQSASVCEIKGGIFISLWPPVGAA